MWSLVSRNLYIVYAIHFPYVHSTSKIGVLTMIEQLEININIFYHYLMATLMETYTFQNSYVLDWVWKVTTYIFHTSFLRVM